MRTSERSGLAAVSLAALGVVFGDIGTSPLYAFKGVFGPEHGIPLTPANVYAALSMIFWTVMLIVSLKTVTLMLRFDNRGEGGVLALLFGLGSAFLVGGAFLFGLVALGVVLLIGRTRAGGPILTIVLGVSAYLALPEIVGSLTDDAVGAVLEVGR